MNKQIAIYARVSTDEQGKGYSLPTQIESCRKYAQEHGYTPVVEFEEDFTGTLLQRPEMDKLRDLVKTGTIQGIIIYELDRLSRKMAHQLLLEEEFRKANVSVEYVMENYADTPEGQLQKQVRGAIAEYEREKIRERTVRGRKGRAQAGYVVPGGYSMYGYRYVASKEGHKGWYEVEPAEAHIVKQIFEWYVYGDDTGKKYGIRAIARKLSEMKVPTRHDNIANSTKKKRDSGVWCERTIATILKRESYAGTHYYNTTITIEGKTKVRDKSEWIPMSIPAIIDRSVWEAAQVQSKNNISHAKRNTKQEYLLKGLVKCAKCGQRFYADGDTRYGLKKYYRCCGQDSYFSKDLRTPTCSRSIKVQRTDEYVWEYVKALLTEPKRMLQTFHDIQAESGPKISVLEERLATVEQEITSLQKQSKKLLDLFLDENAALSKEMFNTKTKDIQQQLAAREAELLTLRRQIEEGKLQHDCVEQAEQFCQKVRVGLENATFEQKRSILMLLKTHGLIKRGNIPADDVLVISGCIPPVLTPATDPVVCMATGI